MSFWIRNDWRQRPQLTQNVPMLKVASMSVNIVLDKPGPNICRSPDKSINGVPLVKEYVLCSLTMIR